MRKKEGTGMGGLREAIARAWSAFEAPEHQARIAEDSAEQAEQAKLRSQAARQKKLIGFGVPRVAARLIAYERVKPWNAIGYVQERPDATLLVLSGNPGSGKTLAACTRIEERETGQLMRAADFVELGSSWAARDRLAALTRYGVLVIDDLGVEYRDDQMVCRLDGLLDARAANGLPTIITTNLPSWEFRKRYEERIWSRIVQFGDYVELDDPDLRVTPIGAGRKV